MAGDLSTLGIISYQPIARSMAGPAIRCWELARALSTDADVVLFAPGKPELKAKGFRLVPCEEEELDQAVRQCDALLVQGFTLNRHPDLAQLDKFLIVDLYVPLIFEALVHYEHKPLREQDRTQGHILMATIDKLAVGDFFICASERQRDYWLGWLSAIGRITPQAYHNDNALRQLIEVVPFGLPDEAPAAGGKVLKGVHPQITKDDKVLLWGGGLYNWMDPFTPIRAVAELQKKRNDVKLFFLGARHPDPNVPPMGVYEEAVELSRKLGVLDQSVFFNDRWVQYHERGSYLLEADLGASANIPHVETRFSFRTRILDCIWAGKPVVTTSGDSLSDLVKERGLGLVVPSGDIKAYAAAVERLLDDEDLNAGCRKNIKAVAAEFKWSRVVEPIRRRLGEKDTTCQRQAIQRLGSEELWGMVRKKEDDIAKLWKMVREKDSHIGNFREMVADKDRIIGELQKVIALKDRDLERLRLKDRRWEKGRLCLRTGAHRIREAARKVSNKARWR